MSGVGSALCENASPSSEPQTTLSSKVPLPSGTASSLAHSDVNTLGLGRLHRVPVSANAGAGFLGREYEAWPLELGSCH